MDRVSVICNLSEGSLFLKSNVKDALSRLRQFMGLPHDKTRSQIQAIKAAFDPVEIEHQRITLIARAIGQTESTIRSFVAELGQPEWDEFYHSKLWNEHRGSMSIRDGTSLYALVRALSPKVCVETGVAGGCSSTYILSVLERENAGRLFSIDVRGPHASHYGELIPERLRKRWKLRIQQGKPVLPDLLQELGTIDFFLHDSRHTFRHMTWEYELAWNHLRPGGCLASHDVVTTTAFDDFRRTYADQVFGGGTIGNFGFLIKQDLKE
jgi:predicted O-methyltransferase YrrM